MARTNNSRGNQSGNYGNNNAPQKKHTGATMGIGKNGMPYTTGWNYSRRLGMVTFLATHYKGTSAHTSRNGRVWENVMVKVSKPMCKDEIVSGLRDPQTGLTIVKELGITINPKAKNGGYCGRFGTK